MSSGTLCHDADGSGGALPIQFVALGNPESHPALGAADFAITFR
jgi:hypothetical protein